MDWRFFLLIVVFSGAGVQVATGLYSSEADAERFLLEDASPSLYQLYDRISAETYDIDDNRYFFGLENSGMVKNIRNVMLHYSREARKYKVELFQNPAVIKGLRRLSSAGFYVLDDDYFSSLVGSLSALHSSATDMDVCSYLHAENCNLAYLPEIRKIFSNSLDPKELQHYWEEWRKKQLGFGIYHIINVVELFRKAAKLNGMSVSEFWFREYDDAYFFDDMETVMQQLKPFYQEFHAYIRKQLAVKYGNSVVNQEGPIPDHLVEQVLLQAWKKQSVLSHAYPRERLPNLQEGLEAQGFNTAKILNQAEDFYRSLGFDPVKPTVKQARFKEISQQAAGKDCKADIFDKTSNVYMKYCPAASFKKFLQTHGYLGRVHYALEKKDLPFYFFSSFDLEYPLGEATILSASTPAHMNRADILNNFNYTNELAMNRLFRMGVHTIFNIPLYFVNVKVMKDVLDGRVPIERINRHYWKLMDEYAGIEPPADRKLKYVDFSYKFYEDLAQNHQTRKFVSEILGYQMYESFCLMSGSFVPGDHNNPLHGCDFYGNLDVGVAIKKMMQLGSTLTWREAISRAVQGSTAMSANSLLQYYKPLYAWLQEKNRASGTKVGWTPSTRIVL